MGNGRASASHAALQRRPDALIARMLRDEEHQETLPRARTHVSCALGTYAFSSADAVAGRALRAAMSARLYSSTELRSAHTACVVLRLKPMSYGLGGTRPVSSQSRSPTWVSRDECEISCSEST